MTYSESKNRPFLEILASHVHLDVGQILDSIVLRFDQELFHFLVLFLHFHCLRQFPISLDSWILELNFGHFGSKHFTASKLFRFSEILLIVIGNSDLEVDLISFICVPVTIESQLIDLVAFLCTNVIPVIGGPGSVISKLSFIKA